jgi:hypothetical protein
MIKGAKLIRKSLVKISKENKPIESFYLNKPRVIHKENFRLHIENTFFFGFFHF